MTTQAVILAAGLGTRLRPTTDSIPKPLIPVLGMPLLEWHIRQFKKHGVTNFLLNLHYLPEVIRAYCGDGSRFGVRIQYNEEPIICGTAGALLPFADQLQESFFLVYGDTFSLVDYTRMAAAFAAHPDAVALQRMAQTQNIADADVAEVAADGRLTAIHPKPHLRPLPNAHRMRGIFLFTRAVINAIPTNRASDIGKDLLPELLRRGAPVYAYTCSDYSKGIDTKEKWDEVETWLHAHHITPPV